MINYEQFILGERSKSKTEVVNCESQQFFFPTLKANFLFKASMLPLFSITNSKIFTEMLTGNVS